MTANAPRTPLHPSRDVGISKAMSFVLRHGAEKEGLKMDGRGYVQLEELVSSFAKPVDF